MVYLSQKLDIVTYLAIVNGKRMLVWELENSFVIHLHAIERANRARLGIDIEDIDID